ncbi:hypothetical protein [Vineibacter terrae]|uniref:hypothetical protein n=1 Tax=Vineibacter terrae TaxID=2586908 RepID=UPI002E335EAA|nr:hypothetical protein [Vineibacter terrae]HEX2888355.1 hypothetical protein [Vineibacter terrae]
MARSALTFLGFGSRKAETDGDKPPEEEKDKNPSANGEEEDKTAKPAAEEGEDNDEDNAEQVQAAARAAVLSERERIAAIVSAGGAGKVEAALQIALNTDMSAADAGKLLGALPSASTKRSPLATAMEGRSPLVGASGGRPTKPRALADIMQAQLRERGFAGKES